MLRRVFMTAFACASLRFRVVALESRANTFGSQTYPRLKKAVIRAGSREGAATEDAGLYDAIRMRYVRALSHVRGAAYYLRT